MEEPSERHIETYEEVRKRLNVFGNLESVPYGWTLITDDFKLIDRLDVPYVKVRTDWIEGYRYKPVFEAAIPTSQKRKFTLRKNKFRKAQTSKKENEDAKLEALLQNNSKIAEALYSINKQAKHYRDKQQQAADELFHRDSDYDWEYAKHIKNLKHLALHRNKERKEELYALKTQVLSLLQDKNLTTAKGLHEFEEIPFVMLEFENFTYHIRIEDYKGDHTALPDLGELDNIDAARKRSMPPAKAEKLLTLYLKLNKKA